MIDVLPRFAEQTLRLRIKHAIPSGMEVIILRPQGIFSARKRPTHRHKEIYEKYLENTRYSSPVIALFEITYNTLRLWLNEDPLLWCQYGAKFKINKISETYTITLYPYLI